MFRLSPASDGSWNLSTLYQFINTEGQGIVPMAGLIFDQLGNLYGTTSEGGFNNYPCTDFHGCGTVFELSLGSGGTWHEQVLYQFMNSPDGNGPYTTLVLDGFGNLYGTTVLGGTDGSGTVFKLFPSSGGQWTETVVHSFEFFGGRDGSGPDSGLIFDQTGNLYGTTQGGGRALDGTVYEITP